MWINNCIGQHNYISFFAMTTFVGINFTISLATTCVLWDQGDWDGYLASMVVNWIVGFVIGVFDLLVLALLGFHVFLRVNGYTTYDFLTRNRTVPEIGNEGKEEGSKEKKFPQTEVVA